MTRLAVVSLFFSALGFAAPSRAVDTYESFGRGVTDFELYGTLESGFKGGDHIPGLTGVAGYGVSSRASFFATGSLCVAPASKDYFGTYSVAVFGTVLEGEHWDLDVGGDLAGGKTLEDAVFSFGFELNYDRSPEADSWGAFLFFLAGTRVARRPGDDERFTGLLDLSIAPGVYVSPRPGDQILLQADVGVEGVNRHRAVAPRLMLGYNSAIDQRFELITECSVGFDASTGADGWEFVSVGLALGGIFTIE